MSDILKNLPTGASFNAVSGSGNFQSKFKHAAKTGNLSELKASQEAIIKLTKRRQDAIRKGEYSKSQVDSDVRSVSNLSNQGKRDLRQILTHLSTSKPVKDQGPKATTKAEKKRAELHPEPFSDGPLDFMKKPSSSINNSGSNVYNPSGSGGGILGASSSTSGTSASQAASGSYRPPALKI